MTLRRLSRDLKRKLAIAKKELAGRSSRYVLRQRVKKLYFEGKPVRVVIGAGPNKYESWLSTDLPVLDALNSAHWNYIFLPGSIDRILAEHVIEHWTSDQFSHFLRIVKLFLSKQGFIRIAVPDGFHPDQSYIDYVKPGGSGSGADDHKMLYNHVIILRILSEEDYDNRLLEYFDEKQQFHYSPWETSDGFVSRSSKYDPRNNGGNLSYTSLIVDAYPRMD